VRAAARLKHPNIVTAYDGGRYQDVHYLVMEYVDGEDLARRVARDGRLPVAESVSYVLQAARALEFAHQNGVIHRDTGRFLGSGLALRLRNALGRLHLARYLKGIVCVRGLLLLARG